MTPIAISSSAPTNRRGAATTDARGIGSAATSTGGCNDLVPQLSVLLFVAGPQFVLGALLEGAQVGCVDLHAVRFEQLLGAVEIVDAVHQMPGHALRLTTGFHDQRLLVGPQAVPDAE